MKSKALLRTGFTLVELLIVVAIIGLLLGLTLPAIQQAREAGRVSACRSNLRQIGLAVHLFHDANRVFPASGWTTSGPGNPAGKYVGWRAMCLPFLEQTNLHDIYNFDLHWWEGTNAVAASVPVPIFKCPSVPTRPDVLGAIAKPPRPAVVFANPIAPTDYEALMGIQPRSINAHVGTDFYSGGNRFSIMHRNSRTRFAHVTDGTSQTIAIVECGGRPIVYRGKRQLPNASNDQGIGWADSEGPFSLDGATRDGSSEGCGPGGGCIQALNARNDNEPYSMHVQGCNVLYVDGHVSFVSETIDLTTFAAASTKAAGEFINGLD